MGEPNILLKVESEAELSVRQVSAWEQLGRPFTIEIVACSREPLRGSDRDPKRKGACIDLGQIAGYGAALRVQQDDGLHKVWTGVCSQIKQVRFDETPGAESTYHLTLVPYLWLLSQRRGHRIFQHRSIPAIVQALFEEWHLKFQLDVDTGRYPVLEYVTQYGESDLDFVHRLLEQAGIVYFFGERDVGGGKAQSFIVLTDQAHAQPASLELPFASNPNEVHGSLYATNVQIAHRVRPGLVTLGDYNFRKPRAPLFAQSSPAPDPEGKRERYEFSPGGFRLETGGPSGGPPDEQVADDKSTTIHDAEGEGKARAQRFLEGERHKKRSVIFETSAQNLAAGMVLTITDHPLEELQGQNLLVIESMDHLDASGAWGAVAEAVFTDVPYRSPRRTPKPRVAGVQSAIVVGPKGEEIHTDEFGRVRVRFHWDREGEFDDNRTCWLRVSQGWAGAQYGTMMVPRIGHEVIVDFLGGDPDEPVIVGRLFTQPAPIPYKLPDHKTRSTWQTNSTPSDKKSKHYNELTFEDKAGEELVYVQAERNYLSLTKHDETERTGENRTMVVGAHRLGIVGAVDSVHVGKQHLVQMVKAKDLRILEQQDPKTKPKRTWIEVVDERITLTTGKSTIVLDGPDITVEAKDGIRMSADQNLVIKGGPLVYINASPAKDVTAEAQREVKDAVAVPDDGVLNSIVQLFAEKQELKKRQQDKEIAVVARVSADTADMPQLLTKHQGTQGKYLGGKPFVDGASANDVVQGQIADCYLAASMASVAHARPDLIEKQVTQGEDGQVTVTFKDGAKSIPVVVDTEVPVQGTTPIYAKSSQTGETWPSLVEKAYAEQYGMGKGYEGIGNGGNAGTAMRNITGGRSDYQPIKASDATDPARRKALLAKLSQADKYPTVAGTAKPPEGTHTVPSGRVAGWHAYSVLGTGKDADGNDIVKMRNPWGGTGGTRGEFDMPLEHFCEDYSNLYQNIPPGS